MSDNYGRMTEKPFFAWHPATEFVGFDAEAGVGDKGNPHALLESVTPGEWTDGKYLIQIDSGLWIDGASVPNAAYRFLDANALDLIVPGYLHDYGYRTDAVCLDAVTLEPMEFERNDWDDVYQTACLMAGCDSDDARRMRWTLLHSSFSRLSKRALSAAFM